MKKKLIKIITLILAAIVSLSCTACASGSRPSNDPNSLDIYLLHKGYGITWLESTYKLFQQQAWVKEKYPDLKVTFSYDAEDVEARRKIQNAGTNMYDVLFGVNIKSFESSGLIADLTDSVYLAEVPGESGVKVIDKVSDRVKESMYRVDAPARPDGNESYYVVNYIDGLHGMLYNHDLLVNTLQMDIPLTTEQFLDTCAAITSTKYNSHYGNNLNQAIINCPDNGYWSSSFRLWWAQYEGKQGIDNYYNLYDPIEEASPSKVVLDQEGRLEALEVVEDVLVNYGYDNENEWTYKVTQTAFLKGFGVFHYNGDYFATEMALQIENYENNNQRYDIRFMKMPVISSIVEKLDLYTHGNTDFDTLTPQEKDAYDAKLQAIITEIDNDVLWADSQAKLNGVSKSDFEKVAEARSISAVSTATGQVAVVPEYSPAKNLAADFLRFMYTDVAIKNFAKSSKGIIFPTTYDMMADTETFNSFDPINVSKMELAKGTSNYPFIRLPADDATRYGAAGLTDIKYSGKFEVNFRLDEKYRLTPKQILDAEKEAWSDSLWSQMIASAPY